MNRKTLFAMVLMTLSIAFSSGCISTGKNPVQTASTVGTLSAAAWVAYDNPSTNQKANVVKALEQVKASSAMLTTTQALVTVFYPAVQKWTETLPEKDRPLVQFGSLLLLTSADQMFASDPSWREDLDDYIIYTAAFIDGAELVLVAPPTDAMMKLNAERQKLFKK